MYENIAENLRYLRASRDLVYSQREIAKKLHVSKSTYARYERGELIPRSGFYIRWLFFMGYRSAYCCLRS